MDYNNLSSEDRQKAEFSCLTLATHLEFNRRIDIRQQRLEDALVTVSTRTEVHEDVLAELRERLQKLEQHA